MAKKLVQIIESCSQCPFKLGLKWAEDGCLSIDDNYCNYDSQKGKLKILSLEDIPEFCPLEDFVEEVEINTAKTVFETDIDLSCWSKKTREKILHTLKMGEELSLFCKKIKEDIKKDKEKESEK